MSDILRICVPYGNHYFFNSNGTKMTGVIGDLYNDLVHRIAVKGNFTLKFIRAAGFGFTSPKDSSYMARSGCFAKTAGNETDTIASLFVYPIEIENVTQIGPVAAVTPQFLTTYKRIDESKVYSLLNSSLSSISLFFWLQLLLAVICLIYLLRKDRQFVLQRRVGRKRCRGVLRYSPLPMQVIGHIFRLSKIAFVHSITSRIVFFITSFMSLVIVVYFASNIKTELVVRPKPDIYTQHSQLLQKGVKIFFFRGMAYGFPFKYAAKGSIERQLWDLTLKTTQRDVYLITGNSQLLGESLAMFIQRRAVLLLDSISGQTILSSACAMIHDESLLKLLPFTHIKSDEVTKVGLHLSQDENAPETLKSIVFGKHFMSNPTFKFIERQIRQTYETGQWIAVFEQFARQNLALEHKKRRTNLPSNLLTIEQLNLIHECSSGQFQVHNQLFASMRLKNVEDLFILLAYLVLGCKIVLIFEKLIFLLTH